MQEMIQCPEEDWTWSTGNVQEAVLALMMDHHLKSKHQGYGRAGGTRLAAGASAIVERLIPVT